MQWTSIRLLLGLWLASVALAARGYGKDIFRRADDIKARVMQEMEERSMPIGRMPLLPRQSSSSPFLNNATEKFLVNGTGIPEVNFDVGESYSGLLPISADPDESRQLFFWFFPSSNPDANEEIVIWLNGGPGCSSLLGLLTENGPFLWQAGTLAPTQNTYSWTNLTNVVWIEQPVGVGYSQGTPNITNEEELSVQFAGFYKQFAQTFGLQGYKIYITGESYAGQYIPWIANQFINENDTTYYNLKGLGINDPVLGDETIQEQVVATPFADYWSQLFNLNATFLKELHDRQDQCGYTSYIEQYYKFPPPPGPFPVLPDPYASQNYTCDQFDNIYSAALEINPCFDIYHIVQTCPTPYDVLGIVNQGDYEPPGAQTYFNRSDVKAALHAPADSNWMQCTDRNVFNYGYVNNYTLGDTSLFPAQTPILQHVFEALNNTIIGVGNLDFILPPNGTLFALQNVTWGGLQGFQEYPQQNEFYVPYHPETNGGRKAGAGIVGYWGEERGVIFYTVQLAGHELPGYAAGAGYRMLEKLLGRVTSLSEVGDFTTQSGNYTGTGTIYKRGGRHAAMPAEIGM